MWTQSSSGVLGDVRDALGDGGAKQKRDDQRVNVDDDARNCTTTTCRQLISRRFLLRLSAWKTIMDVFHHDDLKRSPKKKLEHVAVVTRCENNTKNRLNHV